MDKKKLTSINQFLSVLGYQENDKVYLRLISRDKTTKPKKLTAIYPLTDLPQLREPYNLFYVVNGQGQKSSEIETAKALFCEFDDLPIYDQRIFWKKFNLPKPSIQLFTGGKSIHHYWIFSQPVPIAKWKILIRDLIDFVGCDKANKDPSRILRLPEIPYCDKSGKFTGKSEILSSTGKKYTFEELRSAIPEKKEDPPKAIEVRDYQIRQNDNLTQDQKYQLLDDILSFIPIKPKGLYHEYREFLTAIKNEYSEDYAIDLAVNHLCKYSNDNWYQIIKSSNGSFSLGTIINFATNHGFNFVHWLKENNPINKVNNLVQNYYDNQVTYEQWLQINQEKNKEKFADKINNLILKLFGKHKPKKQNNQISDNVIRYKSDTEKLEIIKNFDTILDQGFTGSGKSYFIGNNSTQLLINNQVDQVIYLSQDHTNPTNENIRDNYRNLMPRHKGLNYDEYGRLIHNQSSDNPDIVPNCINTSLFNRLNSQGHNLNKPTLDKNDKVFPNPICAMCPQRYTCRSGNGSSGDVNFLAMRRQALKSNFLRANFDQLDPKVDYSNRLLIIDEADREIDNMIREISASQKDLRLLYSFIPSYFDVDNYHLANLLQSFILDCLIPIFTHKDKIGRYGLDMNEVRELIDNFAVKYFLECFGKIDNNLIFKFLTNNHLESSGYLISYLLDTAVNWFKLNLNKAIDLMNLTKITISRNYQDNLEKLNDIPTNILEHLRDIYCKDKQGYFRFVKGKVDSQGNITASRIICTIQDERKLKIFREAKKLILLTATPKTIKTIALLRGCEENEVTIIEKKVNQPTNHKISIITNNKGIAGNQWSDQAIERIKNLVEEKAAAVKTDNIIVHGKLNILDRLSLALPNTHFWGGVERGSNLFDTKKLQIICGKPQQDLGSAKATYITLFGNDDEFDNYYRKLTENNLLQQTGRLRAINRPDEKLETVLIVNDIDPQFLIDRGYSVSIEDLLSSEFTHSVLSKKQQRIRDIRINLPTILLNSKVCPSLKSLAKELRSDIKTLSKDLKEIGLNQNLIKTIWNTLQITNTGNSQKPIRNYIENCEFLPQWFKDKLDNYFSYLQSKFKLPFWELNLTDLELDLDLLLFSGWFLLVDPKIIVELLADTRT